MEILGEFHFLFILHCMMMILESVAKNRTKYRVIMEKSVFYVRISCDIIIFMLELSEYDNNMVEKSLESIGVEKKILTIYILY